MALKTELKTKKISTKAKRQTFPDKLSNQSSTKVKCRKIKDSLDVDKLDKSKEIADISSLSQQSQAMKKKKLKIKNQNLKKAKILELQAVQDTEDKNDIAEDVSALHQQTKEKKRKKVQIKKQNLKNLEVLAVQDAEDKNDESADISALRQQTKEKKMKKIEMKKKNSKRAKSLEVLAVQDAEDKNDETADISALQKLSKEKKKKKINQNLKKAKDLKMQAVQDALPKEKKKKKLKRKLNLKNVGDLDMQNEAQNATEVKDDEVTHPCSDIDADQDTEKKTKSKGMLIQRSEASLNISEFNLNEIGKEKVKLTELIKTLNSTSSHLTVKNQLKSATKLKKLTVPLSKPQLEKIKRSMAYGKVCDQVAKWDPIVKSNRLADQIVYPLKKPEIGLDTIDKISERFVTKTPLEEEVAKLLSNSENVVKRERILTVAEEKALQAMSLDEAKARHGELMKHRALLSYKESKARRQNKIKSKKYHRLLKKERLKGIVKEFETLQKVDPAAAYEKYVEADKLRILERMTLKHRNTGKWAKQHKLRAKYNPDSRSFLKEDITIGKQLREKLLPDVPVRPEKPVQIHMSDNEDSIFDSRHHIDLIEDCTNEKNFLTEDSINKKSSITSKISTEDFRHEKLDLDEKQNIDRMDLQTTEENVNESSLAVFEKLISNEEKSVQKPKSILKENKKETSVEQDINFSTEVTFLESMVPDDITAGDEGIDDVEGDTMNIRQAFADEGLIAEFREEKKAADKANEPQGLDLYLPGWGSWGGPSIKPNQRKRKHFLIQPVETLPKKNTLGSVIINEDRDKKIASHQVSHLPFPFTNVHQFDSYIRQPIGNTWNPETSFQKFIAPKVITKSGKIIEPLDSEDVILEENMAQKRRPINVKKKFKTATELKAF